MTETWATGYRLVTVAGGGLIQGHAGHFPLQTVRLETMLLLVIPPRLWFDEDAGVDSGFDRGAASHLHRPWTWLYSFIKRKAPTRVMFINAST